MSTAVDGLSFTGVLALLLIALKLINVITWSWWLVLSPLWVPAAVGLLMAAVAFVVIMIAGEGE